MLDFEIEEARNKEDKSPKSLCNENGLKRSFVYNIVQQLYDRSIGKLSKEKNF